MIYSTTPLGVIRSKKNKNYHAFINHLIKGWKPLMSLSESGKIECHKDAVHELQVDVIKVLSTSDIVLIHPFANGNGRHARLMTDIFLLLQNHERFLWGDHQKMTSAPEYVRILCFKSKELKKEAQKDSDWSKYTIRWRVKRIVTS